MPTQKEIVNAVIQDLKDFAKYAIMMNEGIPEKADRDTELKQEFKIKFTTHQNVLSFLFPSKKCLIPFYNFYGVIEAVTNEWDNLYNSTVAEDEEGTILERLTVELFKEDTVNEIVMYRVRNNLGRFSYHETMRYAKAKYETEVRNRK